MTDDVLHAPVSERGDAPAGGMLEQADLLIVDDQPSNLMSLEAILRRPDYNLVFARSGAEALGEVLRRDFALILLDVAMPQMDGFEVASRIKEREQSRLIPVIFITAAAYEMDHIFRGYEVGAVDYLRKPLDPHAVRAKVAVFVDLFRQKRRNEVQSRRLQEAERLLRTRAEQALRDSEAIYEATFEEAPVGVGHASPEGRWTKTNRKLREILGRDQDDLVGRRVSEILEPLDAERLEAGLGDLRSGTTGRYTGEHRVAVPQTVWSLLTISAMRDSAGRVRRFVVVLDDVSDKKAVEIERARLVADLRKAVEARDDFLSIAAHELRTPITPLRLQTDHLIREVRRLPSTTESLDRVEAGLGVIQEASARLESLVDKLLDVSRISVGVMSLEREDIDLATVIRDVVAHLTAEAEQSGSTIEVSVAEGLTGRWDRLRLGQLTMNLLSNAIKYGCGEPIRISAEAGASAGNVVLRVRDHGVGIPENAQSAIFERFERLGPVRHHGGFGLGLWLVRQIATAHGGRVSVSSRPGEGAELTVELPRRPPEAARVTEGSEVAA